MFYNCEFVCSYISVMGLANLNQNDYCTVEQLQKLWMTVSSVFVPNRYLNTAVLCFANTMSNPKSIFS